MLFEEFLSSDEYIDLMEYVNATKNNKLNHVSSNFDIIYDYYIHLYSNIEECKDSMYLKYLDFDKNQPIIVFNHSNIILHDTDNEVSSEEDTKINDIEHEHVDMNEIQGTYNDGTHDDNTMNSSKMKYSITSVSHPDYPYKSVPFLSFYKNEEYSGYLHDDEDDVILNDTNEYEELSEESELDNSDE